MASHIINLEDDGKSVYFILRNRMNVSEAIVRHARKTDVGVMLEGAPCRTDATVHVGQTVSLTLFENGRERYLKPEPGELSVIFEDDDILIIDKRPGLVVHPSRGHFSGTLCNHVAYYLKYGGNSENPSRSPLEASSCPHRSPSPVDSEQSAPHSALAADSSASNAGTPDESDLAPSPHPVNRLDRDTSGLIVFAKHAHAQNILQAQLHTNSFKRTYLAICEGTPTPHAGIIDAPIARLRDVYGSFGVSESGKHAVTHYRVIGSSQDCKEYPEGLSLVELQLETGRTHQIRVHMSHIGHPLLGDDAYGKPFDDSTCEYPSRADADSSSHHDGIYKPDHPGNAAKDTQPLINRCALHSWQLDLVHPITQKQMHFEAPLPADMRNIPITSQL